MESVGEAMRPGRSGGVGPNGTRWVAACLAGGALLALACAAGPLLPRIAEPGNLPVLDIRFDASGDPSDTEIAASLGLDGVVGRAELRVRDAGFRAPPAALPRIDVRMKGSARLLGAKRFSLRNPDAFRYPETAAVYAQLQREDILVPRATPVRVRVNGSDRGAMIAVDAFSKELVEAQRRRAGVLFRLAADALPVARIEVFGAKKVRSKQRLSTQRDTASGLLQGWLRGALPASQVFDVERVGRILAVAEVWQADALLRPAALRFYFNPVTQRIEPVALDAALRVSASPTDGFVTAGGFAAQLRADPEIRAACDRALPRVARALARGEIAAPSGPGRRFHLEPWSRRAARLPPLDARVSAAQPAVVSDLGARARQSNPIPTAELDEVLRRHPRLRWDAEAGVLRVATGRWDVQGSLVLPAGTGLVLEAGTTLRFEPEQILVASGPLLFAGSAAEPVVLEGRPGPSAAGSWGGIAALTSARPHRWEHVRVRNTTGIDRDGWRPTGAVTIRDAEVFIADSEFSGSSAEDALNLIRSRFAIRDTSFEATESDAFDCDFCVGRLTGGSFRSIGGDGLDLSGSVVKADGVAFEEIADKAISVGESSRLIARRARIRNVRIALAAKDASEVVFEDSQISDASLAAIMAYVKKSEYGPAWVTARNIDMDRVTRESLVQSGSRVHIDEVEREAEEFDVESLYRDGQQGR